MGRTLTAATDLYRTSAYVIRIQSEIHTKFVAQLREIHAQTQNAESELNVVKQTMVASSASVQPVTLAIHLLNAEIWTNVWKTHAERIRFVSTLPVVMTASVNVDTSEIHLQCVHQFRVTSNVMIQNGVLVAKQSLVRPAIDVKMADV